MLKDILHILLLFFSGISLSSLLVVHILFLPLKSKEEKKDPLIEYIDKYKDEFMYMENEEITEEKKKRLKANILFEYTPVGNVMMYYDSEENEFVYYCDRDLSFKFLETIARKYVIYFHCKSLYKIYEEENTKEIDKNEEIKDEPKKKSVYANFKKYNNKKMKVNDNEIILQNKYKYNGKIRENILLQKIENKKENKFTIQDFLMQIKNKN